MSFSCPCLSKSPSRQIWSSSAMKLINIQQCTQSVHKIVFFLVLFHYSHIMKAASVAQSSEAYEHCHIRTNNMVYSHDEKLIFLCLSGWVNLLTPGVWYSTVMNQDEAQRDRDRHRVNERAGEEEETGGRACKANKVTWNSRWHGSIFLVAFTSELASTFLSPCWRDLAAVFNQVSAFQYPTN